MSNIEHMVNRFLAWKLPADFSPDAGIGFKPYHPQQTPDNPMWPTGTNLLTAEQARGMFEYVLEGAQQPRQRPKLTPEDIAAEDAAGGVFAAGALVAQQPQYEAGDIASAAAQGFRDGVASVAQQPQAEQHPDDAAVDAFAAAMKEKLLQARAKGRGGWQTCPPEELSRMLREHVEKGDPRDVANFCMFLWSLGAAIAKKPQAEAVPIGVVVAIDASDPETGPDAIVALHRDVALGAKLYDRPPTPRQAEAVQWGVDWGTHGDRTCVSIIKKHPDGTVEVVATEYEPERLAPQQAEAVPAVTDGMALAFHHALTDGAIGQSELEDIKTGLRAALANQQTEAAYQRGYMGAMELAESVGLIGPASRTDDFHAAIQRFHDLISMNVSIKAAVHFAQGLPKKGGAA